MSSSRLLSRLVPSVALALACSPALMLAQQPAPFQAATASVAAPPSPGSLAWVPPGVTALARQSSSRTDFTFDRSVLSLVGNMSSLDEPTRHAIARLNGIALHLYRFPAATGYDPAAVEAIRAQYAQFGWKHFSTSQREASPIDDGIGHTDVWLNTQGVSVAGAVILLSGPSNVNLIAVSGDLSTLDLLHLRGHFGIPRFPDDALPH